MFLPRLTLRNRFDKILNGHADHHHTHRKKRCAKKKCKERSEWSYVRDSTANLDVSPYCAAHACPWREANGVSCRHSKKSNKLYCKYHLVCQAAPYGNQCSADRSNPLNRDAKFCELHGCSWAGCSNETLPPQGRKTFTYCKDHSCQQPDCAEARIGATGTRQSVYCTAHTCKDPQCIANVSAAPEVGDTKGQHMYCPVHRPCRHADCSSMVHRVSNAEYRKHCSNHYCEFGNNCDEPRAAGVKVCSSHRCRRSGCAKMLQNAVGRYCEDHECKDATGPCLEERVDHSEWCTRHICRDYRDNCKNQGDPNKQGFCVDHVRCESKGCDNKIFIDKGVRRQFCEDHHFGICEYTGCLKPRARDNGHKYHCTDHACLARTDCGYARIGTFTYCTRHKCSEPDCGKLRAQASSLSPAMLNQLNAVSLAPGSNLTAATLNIYDPWCETHRCNDKGCGAQAVVAGGLCATHICREPDCKNRAAQDNGYCDQHCCRERGCLRASVDKYHNYCDHHWHSDDDSDGSSVWSYAGGSSAFGVDSGFNNNDILAAPGWSGPFGFAGAGPQPRRRKSSRRTRSRSGSRTRFTIGQQKKDRRRRTRRSGNGNGNNGPDMGLNW